MQFEAGAYKHIRLAGVQLGGVLLAESERVLYGAELWGAAAAAREQRAFLDVCDANASGAICV